MRNDARKQIITNLQPFLENFDNTTRFIQNDYQKFRNDTDRDIRDLYSMNQDTKPIIEIFDDERPKETIFNDDAGHFGGTKGSDVGFVSLDDKVPDGIKTGIHPDENNVSYSDVYQIEDRFTSNDNPLAYNKVKEVLNRPRPDLPESFFSDDSDEDNMNYNTEILYKDDILDEKEYMENLKKRLKPKVDDKAVNYTPDYFVEDVENNSEEELEPKPEPEPPKKPPQKPKLDPILQERFDRIQETDNFKYYMNGNIKSNEAVELYKELGGTDEKIINAKGRGSINIIKGAISDLLKNTYNYTEKTITKDAKKVNNKKTKK
jgi:hypothetical protein